MQNEDKNAALNGDMSAMNRMLRTFNEERAWDQFHSPRNLAMALNVEAAELLSLYLWCKDDGPQPILDSRKENVRQEAADVLICLLNFCDRAGIDLPSAFIEKLEKNEAKYPVTKSKGCAKKYDEL